MIATAPGKLILTGEYAVLDGAPALVLAMNRRVIARRRKGPQGSSTFLLAVAEEIGKRLGPDDPATKAALEVVVDSTPFYDTGHSGYEAGPFGSVTRGGKLGLGSSAAVTVAATTLALAADHVAVPVIDRELVIAIASAAHAKAQAERGAPGSGADIAAAVYGGVIAFQKATPDRIAWPSEAAARGRAITFEGGTADRLSWPTGVRVIPFFTGASADTATLVRAVREMKDRPAVTAALAAIDRASRAACQACAMRAVEIANGALVPALVLAGHAMDQLAAATGLALVPPSVLAARTALTRLGGTAKTTGAGGGDIAIAVIPATEDVTQAVRYIIEVGCQPLQLAVDPTGVDLQPDAQ